MIESEQHRDDKNRLTRIKILVRKRFPMSRDGFLRWSHIHRMYVAKSKFVWRPYASSRDYFFRFFPESGAIPVEYLVTDRAVGDFILDFLSVSDGDTFAIQSWQSGRTRTGVKFTKHLATIKIISVENRQFEITKTTGLSRYWFRRELSKDQR